jgi:hypothetical protein
MFAAEILTLVADTGRNGREMERTEQMFLTSTKIGL